jgi:hypothetical protein
MIEELLTSFIPSRCAGGSLSLSGKLKIRGLPIREFSEASSSEA